MKKLYYETSPLLRKDGDNMPRPDATHGAVMKLRRIFSPTAVRVAEATMLFNCSPSRHALDRGLWKIMRDDRCTNPKG